MIQIIRRKGRNFINDLRKPSDGGFLKFIEKMFLPVLMVILGYQIIKKVLQNIGLLGSSSDEYSDADMKRMKEALNFWESRMSDIMSPSWDKFIDTPITLSSEERAGIVVNLYTSFGGTVGNDKEEAIFTNLLKLKSAGDYKAIEAGFMTQFDKTFYEMVLENLNQKEKYKVADIISRLEWY